MRASNGRADCPTCGSRGVDLWDGTYAPHGGTHTPKKVPYPCPMTSQPVVADVPITTPVDHARRAYNWPYNPLPGNEG